MHTNQKKKPTTMPNKESNTVQNFCIYAVKTTVKIGSKERKKEDENTHKDFTWFSQYDLHPRKREAPQSIKENTSRYNITPCFLSYNDQDEHHQKNSSFLFYLYHS